jgi:hypothetical protein
VSWGRWGSLDFNKGAAFLPSSSFPSFPSFLMQLETTPGPQHMPCGISERCRNRCQKKYIRKNFSYIYTKFQLMSDRLPQCHTAWIGMPEIMSDGMP